MAQMASQAPLEKLQMAFWVSHRLQTASQAPPESSDASQASESPGLPKGLHEDV